MTDLGWIVALGVATGASTVLLSRRRDAYWMVDPRGLLAIVMCANACALAAYKLATGEVPPIFGLDDRLLEPATLLLVSGQIGFALGTLLPTRHIARRLPPGSLSRAQLLRYAKTLMIAAVVTGTALYAKLVLRGVDALLSGRYGESQWDAGSAAPAFLNVGYIAVPTAVLLLTTWGAAKLPLTSPKLWAVVGFTMLPSVVSGGRRDVTLILFGTVLARALQGKRLKKTHFAVLATLFVALSYVLGISRSGDSLALHNRVEAFRAAEDSVVVRTVTMVSGAAVMTGALNVFPARQAFAGGRTYPEAIANALAPKFITGGYWFTPAGIAFRTWYYGDVTSHGMDYSLAAEAYQNFGAYGPFVVSMILGLVLSFTLNLATVHRREYPSLWLFVHVQVIASTLWALRTDSNTALKTTLYGVIWTLGLWWVSRLRSHTRFRSGFDGVSPSTPRPPL